MSRVLVNSRCVAMAFGILAGVFSTPEIRAEGVHVDVVPYASGTGASAVLLTGGHSDFSLDTIQLMQVFGYDFGENDPYFAGDPGFNNGSTFTAGIFPNDGKLPPGSLVLSLFSGPYAALHYWNGSGAPSFAPAIGGIQINLNRGSANLRVGATTTSGSITVATIPAAGVAAGRVHQHLQSSIGSGGAGSSFAVLGAPDGIYAFGALLSVGSVRSDPIYFVFNQGMDEAIHDSAIEFYEAAVVPEPASWCLAAAGLLGTVLFGCCRRRKGCCRTTRDGRIAA